MEKTIQKILLSQILLFFFLSSHVEALDAEGLVGGEIEEEIRYLVSLQLDGNHTCSGAIIGDKYVVTAAHCVVENANNEFTNKKVKIVADAEDLLAYEPARIEADVEEISIPSEYNGLNWASKYPEGDIAVLKIKQQFDLTLIDGLKKLRLPKAEEDFALDYVMGTVSGYSGKEVIIEKYQNGSQHEVASQRVFSSDALVINYRSCQQYWQSYVTEKNLCAKSVNIDRVLRGSCKGDSGSPLVYGKDFLIGVASGRAFKCIKNANPIVYTRTASYAEFVENVVNGNKKNMRVKVLKDE